MCLFFFCTSFYRTLRCRFSSIINYRYSAFLLIRIEGEGEEPLIPMYTANESSINVWFSFMYSQKWTVQPPYIQNRIIIFCLPIPTLINQWEFYIFPGSACLFCCSQTRGRILEIYKTLIFTWMYKLEIGTETEQFSEKKYIFGIFVAV